MDGMEKHEVIFVYIVKLPYPQIAQGIVELAALNKQTHAYRQSFRIRLDNMPDVFSLFSRQHPDRPACRGAC